MALCDPDRLDGPLNRLLLLGVSARTVAAPLRDRLFAGEPDQGKLATALKALVCEDGLALATCERIKFLMVARPGPCVSSPWLKLVASTAGLAPAVLAARGYFQLVLVSLNKYGHIVG